MYYRCYDKKHGEEELGYLVGEVERELGGRQGDKTESLRATKAAKSPIYFANRPWRKEAWMSCFI